MITTSIFSRLRKFGPIPGLTLVLSGVANTAQANQGAPSSTGSILNILLLVLVAYFLVRMFRRRSGGGPRPDDKNGNDFNRDDNGSTNGENSDGGSRQPPARPMDRYEAAQQMWTMLGGEGNPGDAPSRAIPGGDAGTGFDQNEFLEGAKLFYTRIRQVAGVEELDELRPFLSDDVYREVRTSIESGSYVREEVMLLKADIADMKTKGGRTVLTVTYDATLGGEGDQTHQRRSVWRFSRNEDVENGLWTLDAIDNMN
ncbi:TIM44-like domain-containing protein [Pseudodesulfovibrio sp.]|uniref:TIM44-like domain-containing protein n=1 Tax=unclassified Pseudodesulfovibrio TaxID=2661612 RepID=UPI003AFFA80D